MGRCGPSAQVLGSYDSAYDIPWPSSFLWMISLVDLFNIPLASFPGLSCLYPRMDVYQATALYFVLPLMLVAYVGLVYKVAPRLLPLLRGGSKVTPKATQDSRVRTRELGHRHPGQSVPLAL